MAATRAGRQFHPPLLPVLQTMPALSSFLTLLLCLLLCCRSSNLVKVPHGAWFSLALSAVLTAITYTWQV